MTYNLVVWRASGAIARIKSSFIPTVESLSKPLSPPFSKSSKIDKGCDKGQKQRGSVPIKVVSMISPESGARA
jgi:hypothetical protein